MTAEQIIEFVAANPRCTAKEVGVPGPRMEALVEAGQLTRVGKRATGQRGKPPFEYATPEAEVEVRDAIPVIDLMIREVQPKPGQNCSCDLHDGMTWHDLRRMTTCKEGEGISIGYVCPRTDKIRRRAYATLFSSKPDNE